MAGTDTKASEKLAAFAADLSFEDLPAATIAAVKRMILDTLGTTLAATTLGDGCRETVAVMTALGGAPQATILGGTAKVAAPHAAFANGALAHALNYDPIGGEVGHLGVVCLVAPLAAAQAAAPVSGRRLLTASAVACEITARVTAAIARTGRRPSEKFLSGQLLNYFGAAAGAGHCLGLSADQMRSAFGLALMQMAGSRQIVLSGDPPAKAIYGAFPNQAGVMAALLAKAGLGAACDVFGEPCGLYPLIYGGDCDAATLTDGLGETFLLEAVEFKPWPASNQTHPAIEAAIEISRAAIDPASIAAVTIRADTQLRGWCEPLAIRRKPDNGAAAANSIPFCVAAALAHGDVTLATFTPAGLNDGRTRAIAESVSCELESGVKGAAVSVRTRDGRDHAARIETPRGHRARPLSDGELDAKFRDCCAHAANALDSAQVERLIETVRSLEKLDDIGLVARLASGGKR